MRTFSKFTFVYLALGVSFLCGGMAASAADYVVQKGDSLGSIARKHYGEPVFGTTGSIQKIYKLNPALNKSTVLEPGQKVVLDGKAAPEVAEQAGESKHFVAPRTVAQARPEENRVPAAIGVDAPPIDDEEPEPPSPEIEKAILAARAAAGGTAKPVAHTVGPASEEPADVGGQIKVEAEHHEEPKAEASHDGKYDSKHEAHEENHFEGEADGPHNYITIIPSYSQIKQTATEPSSGTSYSLNSNPALSVELGWDHWWNKYFSTLLTYSGTQLTSQETSDASGALVVHDMYLSMFELSLYNIVTPWMRLGMGAGYGDHIFIEKFTDVPVDPQIYKTAFWNPFLAAEITPYESHRFEWLVNLKVGYLPAQVGLGHDLTAGTELMGQVSLMEKFEKWALLYGISYSTEDQTRTDANETRNEWALKVGVLF